MSEGEHPEGEIEMKKISDLTIDELSDIKQLAKWNEISFKEAWDLYDSFKESGCDEVYDDFNETMLDSMYL